VQIVESGVLGDPYLFDPRAQIRLDALKATVTLYADGDKARITRLSSTALVPGWQHIDLTHRFYNLKGTPLGTKHVQHTIRVIAKDSHGLSTMVTCKFDLPY